MLDDIYYYPEKKKWNYLSFDISIGPVLGDLNYYVLTVHVN